MKFLLPLLLLTTLTTQAQTTLNFDKRFVESEDKWVAFPAPKDSGHIYGFIYIDASAGLTIDVAGSFIIADDGKFVASKILENGSYKVRLQPNKVLVAHLPETKFKELNIDKALPDWLANYKADTNSIARLYRWGFLYNGWNECAKALTYLEKANGINSEYPKLATELAYSYNCLKQYDKAVDVLQIALKHNPEDAYSNKELIYALMKSDKLDEAAESCRNAIKICSDTKYHGENTYNLLFTYYSKKDKKNFNKWLEEGLKWNKDNSKLINFIRVMEAELGKP